MLKQELSQEHEKWILNNAGHLIQKYKLDVSNKNIDSLQPILNSSVIEDVHSIKEKNSLTQGGATFNSAFTQFQEEFEAQFVSKEQQTYTSLDGSGKLQEQRDNTPKLSPPGSNPNSLTPGY